MSGLTRSTAPRRPGFLPCSAAPTAPTEAVFGISPWAQCGSRVMEKKERRPGDPYEVGFGKPPERTRFKRGRSGNPGGRPKRVPDFMEDAAEILGGTVTGQAKGKPITLPAMQAMFRTLCRDALKGDNRALRGVIGLMLTLEPVARAKAKEA